MSVNGASSVSAPVLSVPEIDRKPAPGSRGHAPASACAAVANKTRADNGARILASRPAAYGGRVNGRLAIGGRRVRGIAGG